METSPKYPPCLEDRKVLKLMERIEAQSLKEYNRKDSSEPSKESVKRPPSAA